MGRTYQVSVIGMQGEKKTIDVANSEEEFNNMTVEKFKKKLAEKLPQEASDLSALRLLYTSKQLNDTDKFSDHGIKDKAIICIIIRLPGGR
uniref:Ubiquitin-like domain-containing protein n=1 Tax=Sinocyclocheilus grahami TaxID=75366 RepID=A0A672LEH0_SINGR